MSSEAVGQEQRDPVPPLPTEPYTVIRIHHANSAFDGDVVTLGENGWGLVGSDETAGTAPRYLSDITGFEVLSEPRAVTAKAVIDRVQRALNVTTAADYETLAQVTREFEVEATQ